MDIIYEAEGMTVDEADIKNEIDLQVQQYKVRKATSLPSFDVIIQSSMYGLCKFHAI